MQEAYKFRLYVVFALILLGFKLFVLSSPVHLSKASNLWMKMNLAALIVSRKLLHFPPPEEGPNVTSHSFTAAAADVTASEADTTPFHPTPFQSSMALTILLLITAFFFLGFFSVYIRRCAGEERNSPSPSRRPSASARRPSPCTKGGGGLDPSAVSSLPLVAYGGVPKHASIDDCSICLSEFQDRETVKLIPYCGHVFHPECVDTWLSSHATCPLCRSAQLFKRVEEVYLDVSPEHDAPRCAPVGGQMEVGYGGNVEAITFR